MTNIQILSCNVRGINDENKRHDVFDYLKSLKYDIYCVQDIHCSESQQVLFKRDWGGDMFISHGTTNSRGVAIMFSNNFECEVKEVKRSTNGNFIGLKIKTMDTDICLLTLYGPNTDEPDFYNEISEVINDFQTGSMIICGDWNLVQDQLLDTKHYIRDNNIRARNRVSTLKEEHNLCDPWRVNNPNTRQYTWFQRNPIKMSRIDFFLISSDILALTNYTGIKPGYRSDHSIIQLQLNITKDNRGKGFWKFNTSLLKDIEYITLIKQIIHENVTRYAAPNQTVANHEILFNISDQLFFETLKMEIRKVTISYSSKKKRNREKREVEICDQLEKLDINHTTNSEHLLRKQILSDELVELRKEKIKGMMLRSKIQWFEEGEKPTKFFASIEKRNYVNKVINKINSNGNNIQDPREILNELEKFYRNLYSSKVSIRDQINNMDRFLNNNLINKLTEEQKILCEGNITLVELKEVLKNMKHDKSPGIDGIPVEFYKVFWNDLGHFLFRSLKSSFYTNELSITQKRGIITCIPKGNKPREFLKNWRPISLLTTDYKILTSIMAKRMRGILGQIVSSTQKGFLKERYIEENTRLIYDLIHYLKGQKREGILLLIDFEKAFDSIDWTYIRNVLKIYNFGDDFIKWFNIVYNDSQSCVINNGKYSNFFNLGRGCRQGDPWSPYLFILAIEPLAQYIKHAPQVRGITVKDCEVKIGQYADDTFLLLDGNEVTIKNAMDIFKVFEKISGLHINVEKTQAIHLGEPLTDNNKCPYLNIDFCEKFRLLGINFSTNPDEMEELNFEAKIAEIRKIRRLYQAQNLSLTGKITVVKMLMLPKLVHLLAVLPTPKRKYMDEINNIFINFIWNNKTPKIQYNILVQDFHLGGLKMIHLNSFCKASKLTWIKRLYTAESVNPWKILALEILKEKYPQCIFECSTENIVSLTTKLQNPFWKEVVVSWKYYREMIIGHHDANLIETVIWNPPVIQNPNLLLRRNEFISKGLCYFKDLFNSETNQFFDIFNIKDKYDLHISQFDFLCLMQSIPTLYKNTIKRCTPNLQQTSFGKWVNDVCVSKKTCNYTYKNIIKMLPYDIKCKPKWEGLFSKTIESKEWSKIFLLPQKTSLDSQTRTFQYKVIHRILPTNTLLHIYNIRNDPFCDKCHEEAETLEHLFHLCPTKLSMWYAIANWMFPNVDLFQYINSEHILLGIYDQNKDLENSIIMAVKRYFFRCKYSGQEVHLLGIKRYLKHIRTLEINIQSPHKSMANKLKWLPLENKFEPI